MSKSVIRTYPLKGLSIFLSVVIVLSIGLSIGIVFIEDLLALRIVIWVFSGIFAITSIVVLLKEAIIYLSFDEESEVLTSHEFIIRRKIPLTKISRIEVKDGFYVFYSGKQKIYTLGADRPNANELALALERHKIKIKW
jgi:hypothetical protein